MALVNTAKRIIESVGKNTKPTYAVVAVAIANAIFKPLSTLLDKKEKPETKKYTALRELLTECVAVPTYIVCGALASKFANAFNNPEKAIRAKSNFEFLGVCTAALLVIPALCSVVIKPITDKIYRKDEPKAQPAKVNTKIYDNNNQMMNTYPRYQVHSFESFRSGGMKV